MHKKTRTLVATAVAVLLAAPLLVLNAGCASKPAADPAPAAATEDAAEQADENVYTGTCKILTGEDLYKMQDSIDDPALLEGEKDNRYAVLVFDEPTAVYARFAGDPEAMQDTKTDMLCLAIDGDYPEGNIAAWEQYDGQKITVQIDPMQTMWPSDVRFPIGCPHTDTAAIVTAN
jgi:hypothetical protein